MCECKYFQSALNIFTNAIVNCWKISISAEKLHLEEFHTSTKTKLNILRVQPLLPDWTNGTVDAQEATTFCNYSFNVCLCSHADLSRCSKQGTNWFGPLTCRTLSVKAGKYLWRIPPPTCKEAHGSSRISLQVKETISWNSKCERQKISGRPSQSCGEPPPPKIKSKNVSKSCCTQFKAKQESHACKNCMGMTGQLTSN